MMEGYQWHMCNGCVLDMQHLCYTSTYNHNPPCKTLDPSQQE